VLTLYQAEWCPFSSAVREILTELGLDFAARQVEPWPEQRQRLREETGADEIPTLRLEDGRTFAGTRAIYGYLRRLDGWEHGPQHRRRFLDHEPARESDAVGQLVGYFQPAERAPADGAPEVIDVPERSRYELRVGGETVGEAAYRLRDGRIVLIHTEIDEALEGRGLGSVLAAAVLEDARRRGLQVVPLCPFMAGYIERHPEHADLVASGYGAAARG
jgi:predicted GNAT family acetyltransferase/glutaredoxin